MPPVYLTKSELAQGHLRQLILSGQAPPGTRVSAPVIAAELAISETPVREAIKSLVAEGWLVERPHSGAIVAEVTEEDIRELFGLRAVLARYAVRLNGPLQDGERLRRMDACLAEAGGAVADGDTERYARCNRTFHELLFHPDQSRFVHRTLEGLWTRTAMIQTGFSLVPERMAASHDEHLAVRQALIDGDLPRAEELVAAHEEAAMTSLLAQFRARSSPREPAAR